MKQKMRALLMLETIIAEPIINRHLTMVDMMHYCEFLIDEVRLYGAQDAFGEAKELINNLQEIAQEHHVFNVLVAKQLLIGRTGLIHF